MDQRVPVICIDGPVGSGKGTIARRLATHLGWHLLDSGVLYRLLAYVAHEQGLDLADEAGLAACARNLEVTYELTASGNLAVLLAGCDVSRVIHTDKVGQDASIVAAVSAVRAALLDRQRDYRRRPGLVADGRDMGSVVFADAPLKIFLTASAEVRARRRYNQLMLKGLPASLSDLLESTRERDARDMSRAEAPLRAAEDAILVDSTDMNVDTAYEAVLTQVRTLGLGR